MNNFLLIDFGSTYTKATMIDLDIEEVIAQTPTKSKVKTTIMDSYREILTKMTSQLGQSTISSAKLLLCSSAFGGFKMVAIGLTESLTAAASKRAALGAGTRILKTYAYHLSFEDILEIERLNPDVILLTGGTDGGNKQFILDCTEKLTRMTSDIPIIVAGNKQAIPEIKQLFSCKKSLYFAENVMPKVNLLQAEDTRKILRQIFFEKIIYAKGLDELAKLSDFPIIPTPTAVLSATRLLSEGTSAEPGVGDLAIVDVGGATTDVHSAANSISEIDSVFYEGLAEPFLKRTVEGDLGMRHSALSLYEKAKLPYFQHYYKEELTDESCVTGCKKRVAHPEFIPESSDEVAFDAAIAKIAVDIGMERHVGKMRAQQTETHTNYYQTGKDLRNLHVLIGTGGAIINSSQPKSILAAALQTKADCLKPKQPTFYVDSSYLLSAIGLLGEHYPDQALRIIKKNLRQV